MKLIVAQQLSAEIAFEKRCVPTVLSLYHFFWYVRTILKHEEKITNYDSCFQKTRFTVRESLHTKPRS